MDNITRAVEYSLASPGRRFANFIIDGIVINIVYNIIEIIMYYGSIGLLNSFSTEGIIITSIFSLVFYVLLYSLQEYLLKGRSIGKYVTNTRVVLLNGEEPGFNTYLVRSLCRMIPFEAFSFLFSAAGWHDTLSKT